MQKLKKLLSKWPWLWLAMVLVCTAAYFALQFFMPRFSFIPIVLMALVSLTFVLLWQLTIKKRMHQFVVEMGLSLDEELSRKMETLSLPYTILDSEGKILWKNEAFSAMLGEFGKAEHQKSAYIRDIFPSLRLEYPNGWEQFVTLGQRIFAVGLKHAEGKEGMTALLLTDETEHLETKDTLEKERGVAGILYIDNYEELLKHTDVNEQSLLMALVEQQIQKYFKTYHGIVCKTERDRFYIFMNHHGLDQCMQGKFELLSQVKEIRAGNTMPVTVSIAFGQGGADYNENLELAQAGMDLALGRGGDQAVVKYPDKVDYYGGKAQGEAAQTRVKARVKAQALRELMALHENI
ncbi:MAG: hypothetical protein J6H18_00905, partial [Lachnospiraceae bacterium]|nr:hypothetical protein [Lachnospiraceae bacterium]